jgi:hypothetical protein
MAHTIKGVAAISSFFLALVATQMGFAETQNAQRTSVRAGYLPRFDFLLQLARDSAKLSSDKEAGEKIQAALVLEMGALVVDRQAPADLRFKLATEIAQLCRSKSCGACGEVLGDLVARRHEDRYSLGLANLVAMQINPKTFVAFQPPAPRTLLSKKRSQNGFFARLGDWLGIGQKRK